MSSPSRRLAGVLMAFAGVMVALGIVLWARPSPAQPTTATWDPLAKQSPEADTVFLPDLSSVRSINAAGGFLNGDERRAQRELSGNYEFGAGRFGPAVRAVPGRGDFIFFPVDGLLDGDEFTLEFWAKSPKRWSEIPSGKATLAVTGGMDGNRLQILSTFDGQCAIHVASMESVPSKAYRQSWQRPCDALGLTAKRWHHVAVTLRRGTLRIYVNGRPVGRLGGVRLLPVWADATKNEGFQIGGEPGVSSGVWISDLRVSRTARTPHRRVRLRSMDGSFTVDADRLAGTVPKDFVGSLKMKAISPRQAKAALAVIREGDTVTATPIKRGPPDAGHPTPGRDGTFSYDWQVVDRSFEWLKARSLQGYIDTDATPHILGGAVPPNPRTPLIGGTYAKQVPNDLNAWATIIRDLVAHVRERRYPIRRWTVWNEPDLTSGFWSGTMEQYLDLYAVTARAVKAAHPAADVGGPELASVNPTWIRALFERARRDRLPLDFIAIHDYSGDLNTIARARALVDHYAAQNGFPTPFPMTIGEFNWSDRNVPGYGRFAGGYWHVRSLGAAYTTAAMIRAVQVGGIEQFIWSHTASVSGSPVRESTNSAPMQLIGIRGEQWAPYNALVGWKRTVGSRLLASAADLPPGVFGLSSKDPATGKIGLVFANYGWAQRRERTVSVTLRKLPARSYRLTRALVDLKHSSRWDVAQDRPEGARHDDLETVERRTLDADGPLRLSIRLPAWSSTFIALEPDA